MKLLSLLGLAVLVTCQAHGQNRKINNQNYYDFLFKPEVSPPLKSGTMSMRWLRKEEVVPILLDELQKAGYEWLDDNRLYHLDSARYVVLTAYSQKSNFGFLYVGGHAATPLLAHRHERGIDLKTGHYDYQQVVTNTAGQNDWISIKKLPENILMLAENWYWYQSTPNAEDNQRLVSREDIVRVLRQDIQAQLAAAPKPGKH